MELYKFGLTLGGFWGFLSLIVSGDQGFLVKQGWDAAGNTIYFEPSIFEKILFLPAFVSSEIFAGTFIFVLLYFPFSIIFGALVGYAIVKIYTKIKDVKL